MTGPTIPGDPTNGLGRRAAGLGADLIWDAIGPLAGRNRVAAAFYDGPAWRRFRKWERLFLLCQGGARRARRQVLRHLDPLDPGASVLEVGSGDGENFRFLPPNLDLWGVDLARVMLNECAALGRALPNKLVHSEAETLPFDDGAFDACYSLGGFTYYGDHARALSEMARVTKPGGILVVADELPHIERHGVGRLIPSAGLIRRWSRLMGVPADFIAMVLDYRDDPEAAIARAWPGATRHAIWSGLGYCHAAIRPDSPTHPDPKPTGGSPDAGPRDHA